MKKFARKCSECGSLMNEGYLAYDEYYCSDKCLPYTKEDWQRRYETDDDCYWTQWECEEDYLYYEDGSEIEDV